MRFEEELKNYLKTSEWKYQKAIDSGFDKSLNDPVTAREAFDQLSGIGAGIIRNPAKSSYNFNPKELHDEIVRRLKIFNNISLSEESLPFLARNLVKYGHHIGTEKDPVYDLIRKGVYNRENVFALTSLSPEDELSDLLRSQKEYDKIKQMFFRSAEPNVKTNKIRKAQELPNRYYNTDPEKKAIEEYYDRALLKIENIVPNENGLQVSPDFWKRTPFGSIPDLPWLVRRAIDNGFLTESSLKNNRIGFKDFVTKLENGSKIENQPGYSEWKYTKPFLDASPYSWHKVPYDINAQLIEGSKMGNCAGIGCIAKPGIKDIYSLRSAETNTPKVNFVHLPGNESNPIEQIKGIANSSPKEKYFNAIEQLKQYLGIK